MTETVSGKDLYQWRQWAVKLAEENDIETSEVDWLLQGLTPLKSLSLRLGNYRKELNIPVQVTFSQLTEKWQQRIQSRVPVQYLVGETPWRNFMITVTPDVLIPRPETELIINIAEELVNKSPISEQLLKGDWADVGTGSGAIALGLVQAFPQATIHATDISNKAIAIAQHNARRNKLTKHISFHRGSWLEPLCMCRKKLSGIITNPPYIPSKTILTLEPEVVDHEPHLALDGGPDGLDYIKTLIAKSTDYLTANSIWLTELMAGQAQLVAALVEDCKRYNNIAIHSDLSGIDRFVSARKAL